MAVDLNVSGLRSAEVSMDRWRTSGFFGLSSIQDQNWFYIPLLCALLIAMAVCDSAMTTNGAL